MKKHRSIYSLLLIVICFIFVVTLGSKMLALLFIEVGSTDTNSRFYSKIITRLSIILLAAIVIKRFSFDKFNGFADWYEPKHFIQWLGVILLIIVSYPLLLETEEYNTSILILYLFSTALAAFAEEYVFRGIFLPLFILHFKSKSNTILWAILTSSLLFGLVHATNLVYEPENFISITSQVIIATSFGLILASFLVKTRNIVILGVIHTYINLLMSNSILSNGKTNDTAVLSLESAEGVSILLIPLVLLILATIVSFLAIRQVSKKELLDILD